MIALFNNKSLEIEHSPNPFNLKSITLPIISYKQLDIILYKFDLYSITLSPYTVIRQPLLVKEAPPITLSSIKFKFKILQLSKISPNSKLAFIAVIQ